VPELSHYLSVKLSRCALKSPFKERFMKSAMSVGRTIGILLLLQLAAGLTVPFILLQPIVAGSPAFLTAAAENSFQIRLAVFISFCRCRSDRYAWH
jgi:hypothetical protein